MRIDRITNADPEVIARGIMSIINSLSEYTSEEKLLAVSAVMESMIRQVITTTDISEADLRTVIGNMDSYKYSRTRIARETIGRLI